MKNKVNLVLILLFTFLLSCYTQKKPIEFFSKKIVNDKVVKKSLFDVDYYLEVNRAEMYLALNKYDSAGYIYKKIIDSSNNYFYGKDLYNLATCDLLLNKIDESKKYFTELFKRGYNIEWINKKHPFYKKFTLDDINFLSKICLDSVRYDIPLRASLQLIYDDDQVFRNSEINYGTNLQKVQKNDSINSVRLKNVLNKYKCMPDEKLIGITSEDIYYHQYYVHIWHSNGAITNSSYVKEVKEALDNFQIEPYYGMLLYSRITHYDTLAPLLTITKFTYPTEKHSLAEITKKGDKSNLLKDYQWYKAKMKLEDIDIINNKRKKYGLESIEHMFFKFNKTNGDAFPFILSSIQLSQQVFQCNTKKDFEGFLNWYEPL
jgi:hypothetical protein